MAPEVMADPDPVPECAALSSLTNLENNDAGRRRGGVPAPPGTL
jgi:hypothetical protein